MPRRSIQDPRVQYAIRRRLENATAKRNRKAVQRALEREGAASLADLERITELPRCEVCAAIDALMGAGVATPGAGGVYEFTGKEATPSLKSTEQIA